MNYHFEQLAKYSSLEPTFVYSAIKAMFPVNDSTQITYIPDEDTNQKVLVIEGTCLARTTTREPIVTKEVTNQHNQKIFRFTGLFHPKHNVLYVKKLVDLRKEVETVVK